MLYVRVAFIVLIVVPVLGDEDHLTNARTVLFQDWDITRECWTSSELVLLTTRKRAQDLVIAKEIPDDLSTLLKFFKWSLYSVKALTVPGDIKLLVHMALADTIGGYLQHVVLPITREGYYAGNVDYELSRQFHALFDALKSDLGTDGGGWAAPLSPSSFNTLVSPLCLNLSDFDEACKSLIVDYNHTSHNEKRPRLKISIPMPYFDDDDDPSAVAVPFRSRSLFSLAAGSSADILLRYYSLSMRCLMGTDDRQNILAFNDRFLTWIVKQVFPHLEECKWYPGFYGVMAIMERMKLMESQAEGQQLVHTANEPFCIKMDILSTDDKPMEQEPPSGVDNLSEHSQETEDWTESETNSSLRMSHLVARALGLGLASLVLGLMALCCSSWCAFYWWQTRSADRARVDRIRRALFGDRRHSDFRKVHFKEDPGDKSDYETLLGQDSGEANQRHGLGKYPEEDHFTSETNFPSDMDTYTHIQSHILQNYILQSQRWSYRRSQRRSHRKRSPVPPTGELPFVWLTVGGSNTDCKLARMKPCVIRVNSSVHDLAAGYDDDNISGTHSCP